MTRVLIVARTRMHHDHVCIGGHDLDCDFRSVRLLDKFGDHWPVSSLFAVGDIWDVDYRPKGSARPPHVEDSFVRAFDRVGRQADLLAFLLRHIHPAIGSPDVLFDHTLHASESGAGYVPVHARQPRQSTGYWQPSLPLERRYSVSGPRFAFCGESVIRNIKWVGVQESPAAIAAGALVRVSLTRPFGKPPVPEGCYLQISGTFSVEPDTLGL